VVTSAITQLSLWEAPRIIERLDKRGDDIWEVCVNEGIRAMSDVDSGKWRVGDIAHAITRRYGERTPRGERIIDSFAYAINADPERVREYRTVAKFWTPDQREEFLNYSIITYTHCRDAMRLKDIELAKDFLRECADNGWTVTQARMAIASRLGKLPQRRKVATIRQATLLERTGTLYLFSFSQSEGDAQPAPAELCIGETFELIISQSIKEIIP